ncbi:hypothetical protein GNZ12_07245 [Paraburkholderia sp. 1N]|uniref:Uncharacterized protein n=1 Tax=Paraburkholderia solitsugae TaxID=2675748 RepID=A0ABX2BLT7_9BURK|nr:hypothetical protein [Paraburkholderia solitsugae]
MQAALVEQSEMVVREVAETGTAVAGDIARPRDHRRQTEAACTLRDPLFAHPLCQQIAVVQHGTSVIHALVDAPGTRQHLADRQCRDEAERFLPLRQREPQ